VTEPVVRLDPTRISVEPGSQVSLVVTVLNPGNRVEGYDLDVVSHSPMPWVTIEPATLSVYPQQEDSAVVTFAPPAGPEARGGSFPFGVRARSQVDAHDSAVAEGDLDVGSVAGLQATLTPVASTGRWRGRHALKISNGGNSPALLRLSAQDPAEALGFLLTPQVVDVPNGGEAVARLKVRTRHPVLRGTNQQLPFQVLCEPDQPTSLGTALPGTSTPERPIVTGTFNQKPILTRMVVVVAGLLLLAGIGGIAYAATRPSPKSGGGVGPAPDTPTGFVAKARPDKVLLLWDHDASVDSYTLSQLDPATDVRPVNATVVPDDPSRMELKLAVATADRYCYQLVARRKHAAPSLPTALRCVHTKLSPKAKASPTPTTSPSIVPIPPGHGAGSSGQGASSSGHGQSSPSQGQSSSVQSAPPQPFIAVLKFYFGSTQSESDGDLRQLKAAGVDARILVASQWSFDPPIAGSAVLTAVDAASAEQAQAECLAAQAKVDPTLVGAGCLPEHVSSPTAAPSPSATP